MMLKDQRRQLVGRTGCGLCGIEHLKQAIKPVNTVPDTQIIPFSVINQSIKSLYENQKLANRTGCTHAAVWLNEHGELAAIYEDVGRHVALDKLIGARAKYSKLTKGNICRCGDIICSISTYSISN